MTRETFTNKFLLVVFTFLIVEDYKPKLAACAIGSKKTEKAI